VVYAYYNRLSAADRSIYRRSDGIVVLELPKIADAGVLVGALETALATGQRPPVQSASKALLDALTRGFGVPRLRLKVYAARPAHDWGELHGLYEPEENRAPLVSVWMRTAQRKQVVAFRTFLRTLVHELCHHLDYELFELEETFHTEGFYKRESSLVRQLLEHRDALQGSNN
jgi:hypothetical protein